MIGRIRGTLVARGMGGVEIATPGGVVYEISVPLTVAERLPALGEEIELRTVHVLREDQAALLVKGMMVDTHELHGRSSLLSCRLGRFHRGPIGRTQFRVLPLSPILSHNTPLWTTHVNPEFGFNGQPACQLAPSRPTPAHYPVIHDADGEVADD